MARALNTASGSFEFACIHAYMHTHKCVKTGNSVNNIARNNPKLWQEKNPYCISASVLRKPLNIVLL